MMPEESEDDGDLEWARFWQTARYFWLGINAWRVWIMCAFLIGIVVLQLYVQFRMNYWNRDFFDALESRSPARLRDQAYLLIPLCAASVTLAVTSVWGRMKMQRDWRKWLTRKVIDYWVEEDRYRRLTIVHGDQMIPEYRIAEDVRIATDAPIDFAVGVISALLTAIIFIQVLWHVGGPISLTLGDGDIVLPGYLVISVVVYSGLVTGSMLWVGRTLPRTIQVKNQAEAELITSAHQLREVGEGATPQHEKLAVISGLWQALQLALKQWRRLAGQLMRTTMVSHLNTLLAPIVGLILCAPKFLAGAMTLGELTQAAAAFTLVQASFNWLVDNYSRVADWISSLQRVGGLLLSLDRLNHHGGINGADAAATPSPAPPLQQDV